MDSEGQKFVAVITINYNQSEMTMDCVKSILNSNYQNILVVVVDNGSKTNELESMLHHFNSKVIVETIEQNCGYVGGINRGLEKASEYDPDYFLIMNNDTIIDENAIQFLVESAERNKQKAIVSGKVYHFNEPNRIQDIGGIFKKRKYLIVNYIGKNELDVGQFENEEERDMLDDIFWLLPQRIYNKIGNYSDDFFIYAEQGDYARRAVESGFKLIYTPKAKLWHKGSITSGDGERRAPHVNYWRKKGSVIYRYKHLKRFDFWIYAFKLLATIFLKSLILRIKGEKDRSLSYIAGCRGVLNGMLWSFDQKKDTGFNPYLKK